MTYACSMAGSTTVWTDQLVRSVVSCMDLSLVLDGRQFAVGEVQIVSIAIDPLLSRTAGSRCAVDAAGLTPMRFRQDVLLRHTNLDPRLCRVRLSCSACASFGSISSFGLHHRLVDKVIATAIGIAEALIVFLALCKGFLARLGHWLDFLRSDIGADRGDQRQQT